MIFARIKNPNMIEIHHHLLGCLFTISAEDELKKPLGNIALEIIDEVNIEVIYQNDIPWEPTNA